MMNRFLISTAVGLFLGLTPALAQDQAPQDENTPAIQSPGDSSEAPSVIDKLSPSEEAPSSQSSETAPQSAAPQSSEAAPQSIAQPDQSAVNETPSAPAGERFLTAQQSNDYLASHLIGETVVNAKNESIGEIKDLVTDKDGKIVAVLVRAGSFLGIGGKDIGVPFKDLDIARDANNEMTVMLNADQDTIAAAPDYQRIDEQQTVESSNKTDREDHSRTY